MAFSHIFNWEGGFLMKKSIFFTASFLGAFSIAIGAFGAHIFEDYLIRLDRIETFETAVRYQFYHTFFLITLGLCYDIFDAKMLRYAFYFVLIGIFLFSGSLYLICLTNNNFLGAITPFGGLSLIVAWFCLFLSVKYK